MADEPDTAEAGEQNTEQTAETSEEKTFTQDDMNKAIEKRIARERAKFENYDELKAKAEKFDEAQNANKTELEKAQARAEKAEKEAALLKHRDQVTAWKSSIAASNDVPVDLLRGETEEEITTHAQQLKAYLEKATKPNVSAPGGDNHPAVTPKSTTGDWLRDSITKRK